MDIDKKKIRKILVIKLKHIGDVLLTVPAVRGLREKFPESEIYALVASGTEDMLRGLPYVKDVYVYDRGIKSKGTLARIAYEAALVKKIRSQRFDLVVEFSGGDRGALYSFVSGAKVRCGYKKQGKGMLFRDSLFTHVVSADNSKHTVDLHYDLVREIGVDSHDTGLDLFIPDQMNKSALNKLGAEGVEQGQKYVVIHPTSRWLFKCWRADGFAAVADHMISKYGIKVIITSSPDSKEREKVDDIIKLMKFNAVNISGRLSLKELASVIKGAVLFVGIDSAPMHIAQAVKVPVVVLFGPSGSHNWGPRGISDHVLKRGWECVPCGKDGCNGTKISKCLIDIKNDEVIDAVDSLLSTIKY